MNVKMVVMDLDNTLLRPDKTISEYTVRILSAVKQKSVYVAFATARSENACRRYTDIINPDAIVSCGGARVRVGDKTVYRTAMDIETVNKLILSCMDQPDVGYITVDTDKGYFVNTPIDAGDPGWVEYLPAYHVDFAQGLVSDAYKITVEISNDATAYKIAEGFPDIDVIPFSGEGWYRFADKNAGKWHGVKALADYLGIGAERVAAFGDDHNDVEMLRECGFGVAVANAIGEAKAAARYACGSNGDDGVAQWLERHILSA